jgi:hypothetical protein
MISIVLCWGFALFDGENQRRRPGARPERGGGQSAGRAGVLGNMICAFCRPKAQAGQRILRQLR